MTNIIETHNTDRYIRACVRDTGLTIKYDNISTPYATESSIVLPTMNTVASSEDLSKLRGFVASVVANKLHSEVLPEVERLDREGAGSTLATLYDLVEAQRVHRIASKNYAGDRTSLTEGHTQCVAHTAQALQELGQQAASASAGLLAACALTEASRSDFDPYGKINADSLMKAGGERVSEVLKKMHDSGLTEELQSVDSSRSAFELASKINKLIEEDQQEQEDSSGGSGDSDDSEESDDSAEQDAASAMSAMASAMRGETKTGEGDPSESMKMEYPESYGHFEPCTDFIIRPTYEGGDSFGRSPVSADEVERHLSSNVGLAATVRRLLQVRSKKLYIGGQKKGKVHARNLSRAAMPIDSYAQRVFRTRMENDTLDTAVHLLVDFSGSMCGSRINTACAAAALLSKTLSTIGVVHEIHGFTERMDQNIQYIIKPFNMNLTEDKLVESFRRAASKGILQNNDGDSLLYSYSSVMTRPEKRKVLIVLSDGSPCCDRSGDSSRYLREVVKEIEAEGVVDLVGIGIESTDVRRYYSDNYTIDNAQELPDAILNTIQRKII